MTLSLRNDRKSFLPFKNKLASGETGDDQKIILYVILYLIHGKKQNFDFLGYSLILSLHKSLLFKDYIILLEITFY